MSAVLEANEHRRTLAIMNISQAAAGDAVTASVAEWIGRRLSRAVPR